MLGHRHAGWARFAALPALLFSLLGADCNSRSGGSVVLEASDGCKYGSPSAALYMNPEPARATAGETVEITVNIIQGCDVSGVSYSLRFEPEHLRFVSGAPGSFLATAGGNVSFLTGLDTQESGVLDVGSSILGADPGGGVSGNGDVCTLVFEVLPDAAAADRTSIVPFDFKVFQPGLREQSSDFPPLTLDLAGP